MDHCARRRGEAFTLTFSPSGRRLVMISDPAAVKTLLTAPPEVAPSAAGDTPIASVLGPRSVITLTGPEHMRQRKLLLPPFHGERMRAYEDTIVQATERDMASWPMGRPMKLSARTRNITLEVILRAVFGVEAERMGATEGAIGELAEPTRTLAMLRFALSKPSIDRPPGELGQALDRLDGLIYDELARRREQQDLGEREDILSLLLQARDEDGQAMTDGELRDELVTLLLAGHETTATAIAWAIERLVRHPDKLARLVAEIDAGEETSTCRRSSTRRCACARSCRWSCGLLHEPLRVGGYVLPVGTRVIAVDLPDEQQPARVRRAEGVPARALPGRAARHVRLDPVRRRHPPLHRRVVRDARDEAMLRTMLAELHPSVPRRSVWRSGEWNRRRAITLVPAAGARVVWKRR